MVFLQQLMVFLQQLIVFLQQFIFFLQQLIVFLQQLIVFLRQLIVFLGFITLDKINFVRLVIFDEFMKFIVINDVFKLSSID
jgi:hypothetical protein